MFSVYLIMQYPKGDIYLKTGAQTIINLLCELNIDTVFGYPGAACAPIYEELSKSSIRHILTRGEQAAAHSAGAYARIKGSVGVCIATSGPGATNLITGIANAYIDSIPLVAITGQVDSSKIGQDAFQEADITGATAPFCKHNFLVKNAGELARTFCEAFYIASTGRPGPVLIDVPVDIQLAETDAYMPINVNIPGYKPTYKGNGNQIKRAAAAIDKAEHPLIVAGGGVIISKTQKKVAELANTGNIPVAETLMGASAISSDNPLNLSMIGVHGAKQANYALNNADLLILLGARAADRSLSKNSLNKNAKIIHIDIDPAEIGKIIPADIPIVGDLNDIIPRLNKRINNADRSEWISKLHSVKNDKMLSVPAAAVSMLSGIADKNAVIVTEVGQNQIWAIRNWEFKENNILLTSGGLGVMGYGLPAAIGAALADSDRQIILIAGDGSFQMSMPELATAAANRLKIKILLIKNNSLGMINELQKNSGYNKFATFLEGSPNFELISKAYGIGYQKITSPTLKAFTSMLEYNGSFLLELETDSDAVTVN